MQGRLFQATPLTDKTHAELNLVQGLWYFWKDNWRTVSGGYKRMDQAELELRQTILLEKQCPSCED